VSRASPASTRGSSNAWPTSWRCEKMPRRRSLPAIDADSMRLGQAATAFRRADRLSDGSMRRRCAPAARSSAWCRRSRPSIPALPSSPARPSYHYKTYERAPPEVRPEDRKPKAMILGAGPNRIGQGIEFDYCCVHASYALHDAGVRDHHGQLQSRDRLHRLRHLRPPVLRAADLRGRHGHRRCRAPRRRRGHAGRPDAAQAGAGAAAEGVHIMGTKPEAIDLAEDRERFSPAARRARHHVSAAGEASAGGGGARWPRASGSRCSCARATCSAGAAWSSPTTSSTLRTYMAEAARVTRPSRLPRQIPGGRDRMRRRRPLRRHERVYRRRLEHIEEAGIHSGDSACCTPPFSVLRRVIAPARDHARWPAPGNPRPDQHPVRRQGQQGLRHRGEPARQPHGAVRVEGHRGAARQVRGRIMAGEIADSSPAR
jgi:carbamoyl-phosphate synthase large subunit